MKTPILMVPALTMSSRRLCCPCACAPARRGKARGKTEISVLCSASRCSGAVGARMPEWRAKNCDSDYERIQYAVQTLFGPHMDKAKAKQVRAYFDKKFANMNGQPIK